MLRAASLLGLSSSGYVCLKACLLLGATQPCNAQNLVPNPSFEEHDTCPYTIGFQEGDRPLHWYSWLESPEYFHACAGSLQNIDTLVSVPQNGWAFQNAFDGEAYVGLLTFANGGVFREYVGTQLQAALVPGQTYCASFRANLAMDGSYWPARWASNNVGLLFTMTSNAWYDLMGPPFAFRNYAHVYASSIITDTAGWTLVSGTFVADSAYQYVVLGNFFEDGLTDTLSLQAGISAGAYFLIDAVCVSPGSVGCGVTGLDEVWGREGPRLWPVPTADMLTVQWPLYANFLLELFDAVGRRLGMYRAQGESIRIEIGDHEPGMYTARLSKGETFVIERFVVQR